MSDPSWEDATKRAQFHQRAPTVKRFYETATVGAADGGFAVRLDGRTARTPAKAPLIVPTLAFAEAAAAEWAARARSCRRPPCR